MKSITVPGSVKVRSHNGEIVDYSFSDLLNEHCWTDPKWRQDKDYYSCFVSLRKKFSVDDLKSGDKVVITDAEYEKLLPIATLEGIKLSKDVSNITYLTGAIILAENYEEEQHKSQSN